MSDEPTKGSRWHIPGDQALTVAIVEQTRNGRVFYHHESGWENNMRTEQFLRVFTELVPRVEPAIPEPPDKRYSLRVRCTCAPDGWGCCCARREVPVEDPNGPYKLVIA